MPTLQPASHLTNLVEELQSAAAEVPFVFHERAAMKHVARSLQTLKDAPADERLAFVFEALPVLAAPKSIALQLALKGAISAALRSGLNLTSLEAVRLVEMSCLRRAQLPYRAVLSALENATMTPALRDALLRLRPCIDEWHGRSEMRELHDRIDKLVQGPQDNPLTAQAAWSRQVFEEIENSPHHFDWRAFFLHARSLTQSAASRRWLNESVAIIERIGQEEFKDAARRWLALGPTPGATQLQAPEGEADLQKGLVWAVGALGDTALAPDLAGFAFACFRKIPMIGAVSHKVGNACVNALAVMPGLDAVAQLSRLAAKVKYDVARRLIERALEEAAQRNNVSRDDLEAMSVPTFGLDPQAQRMESAGACLATLAIESGAAHLTWSREGKPLKSAPAEVKSGHAALLTELKKTVKELDASLSTQRIRLERQLFTRAACAFQNWRDWYLDHPVVSHFARRLIWEIRAGGDSQTAIFHGGALVGWDGGKVEPATESNVRLWHPIDADVQTILSWRCWLEDHQVTQPFKQAHREVYLLTDAERQTATFSNRFAAHIVRQHQFAALCRERGWQFTLMGQWDSHNTPYLDLPALGLRAEFDVEFPSDEEITGHGIHLVIGTSEVRFTGKNQLSVPLHSVPPAVFSEVMRDCDLFVGVTSIGADPTWLRDHPGDRHEDYWRAFAGGELTTAAENRKTVLASLLPKLGLQQNCRLEGRYLLVQGKLHDYRIHLGSGNVLMEPGSRYLCIVQGAGDTAGRVALPFEGDRLLAVILSKAFMLVNDTKIKDETIRRQL